MNIKHGWLPKRRRRKHWQQLSELERLEALRREISAQTAPGSPPK